LELSDFIRILILLFEGGVPLRVFDLLNIMLMFDVIKIQEIFDVVCEEFKVSTRLVSRIKGYETGVVSLDAIQEYLDYQESLVDESLYYDILATAKVES
jgi:hypothetical protein